MNTLPIVPIQILPPTLHQAASCGPAGSPEAENTEQGPALGQRACGWFESSWDLQQGLAVCELPDLDGSVAALWFTRLGSSSARLQ